MRHGVHPGGADRPQDLLLALDQADMDRPLAATPLKELDDSVDDESATTREG
ncbi:MAG: hypothetical protein ACT4NY_00430 [Pseudonocardiales bacterium]